MRFFPWLRSVFKNRRRSVPRPAWCTYLVTYRCNARCQMCDSWQMERGEEMTPQQVADVFGKVGKLDVVRLSGGEPYLKRDLLDIAEAAYAASRPRVLHITTNGSFPDRVRRFVESFSKPRRLQFMVSFDGVGETHDENRGKDVRYETAIETVRRLAELRSRHGLQVSANHTVINPQSLDENEILRETLGAAAEGGM